MIYVIKVSSNHSAGESLAKRCFPSVQPPARKGNTAPLRVFSIASSVIIALGLLYVTCLPE
jgi:hypothetical protein